MGGLIYILVARGRLPLATTSSPLFIKRIRAGVQANCGVDDRMQTTKYRRHSESAQDKHASDKSKSLMHRLVTVYAQKTTTVGLQGAVSVCC